MLVPLLEGPVVVADVGCRWGATDAWGALAPELRVLAFDADAAECARLSATRAPGDPVRYIPVALGATTGTATLYVAEKPACSSLFPADPVALRERPELSGTRTTATAQVQVERLDDWMARDGQRRIDVLKLDVQGAECLVIEGAREALGSVRLIESEVTFTPMYTGQALFGDVDAALRRRGFALWRLDHLVHYGRGAADGAAGAGVHAYYDGRHVGAPSYGGQLYWGHAHFVAGDLAAGEPAGWRTRVRDAAVCACAGFQELARWALEAARDDGPPAAARATIERALGARP